MNADNRENFTLVLIRDLDKETLDKALLTLVPDDGRRWKVVKSTLGQVSQLVSTDDLGNLIQSVIRAEHKSSFSPFVQKLLSSPVQKGAILSYQDGWQYVDDYLKDLPSSLVPNPLRWVPVTLNEKAALLEHGVPVLGMR